MQKPEIWIGENQEQASKELFARFEKIIHFHIHAQSKNNPNRPLAIALSGGESPRLFYQLAKEQKLFFDKPIHLFLADERYLPITDPQRNLTLLENHLLSQGTTPKSKSPILHEVNTSIPIELSALSYEQEILSFFSPHTPVFDIIVLGLGSDGHTASLFPKILQKDATSKELIWPILNAPPPFQKRITMTPRLINWAKHIFILAFGANKSEAVFNALHPVPPNPLFYPTHALLPALGKICWLLDKDSSSMLKKLT